MPVGENCPSEATRFQNTAVIGDRAAWRSDLMRTGRIVQDDDEEADRDQADRDCRQYIALVEMVEGTEGADVFLDLIESMQVSEDYEVYEATVRVLHRFRSVGGRSVDPCGIARAARAISGESRRPAQRAGEGILR